MNSRTIRTFALLFVAALFVACDEDDSSGNGSSSSSSSGGSSSLSDYADDPCGLMSAEDVRAVVSEMPADAEHYTGTARLKMCQYSWPSDRKASRTVMGKTMEYPVNNVVCLQWVKKIKQKDPLAWFKNAYKTMTPEEKAQMKAAFEKAMAKKVESGEVSRDGQKIGMKATGSMADNIQFETVDGIGTAAAWGGMKDAVGLKVLDGDWMFEISVIVSADDAKNREASIALAKRILANAK